jgi:hypothetical protein
MAQGLFNSVVSMGRSAIQRFQGDLDPYVVRPVDAAEYNSVFTQDRHDGLVFCGPRKAKIFKKDVELYEIVVLAIKNDGAFW